MSFQEAFRSAKGKAGPTKLTAAQRAEIKKKRKLAAEANVSSTPSGAAISMGPPPPKRPAVAQTPTKPATTPDPPPPSTSPLPADFFDPAPSTTPAPSAPPVSQQNSPPAGPSAKPGSKAASALPKGFFDDKTADAAAQGVKPVTAADKEKDFLAFQAEMTDTLRKQAEEEAAVHEEEATYREGAEDYEQLVRRQRLEAIRPRAQHEPVASGLELPPGADTLIGVVGDEAGQEERVAPTGKLTLQRRRRVIDVMEEAGTPDGSDSDGGSESDGDLNWRSKAM